jgi:hypothetical protein
VNILLDEGVPTIIKKRLTCLSISTVEEMGWRGKKNGALLDLMAGRFDIIVTTDKNLSQQQNLPAIVIIGVGEFREIPMPSRTRG